jgi:hypothetical protein
VTAAVDGVAPTFPGRARATERKVVLDDGRLEAAAARIDSCREAGEAAAADDDES